ncbi:MAG TPA: hypothetical protein VIL78_07215 [Hanamia sp.]
MNTKVKKTGNATKNASGTKNELIKRISMLEKSAKSRDTLKFTIDPERVYHNIHSFF